METIKGTVNKITWRNEENGWTVAQITEGEEGSNGRPTTIVGVIPKINHGEIVEIKGKWIDNKRYGKQFQVETLNIMRPETIVGIKNYLSSSFINGIGPEMANRIIKKFGEDTIKVIDTDISKLSQVEGIGPKRIMMIKKSWDENKYIKEIMIFLQGKGVSTGLANKIYKRYKEKSLEVLNENPYRIADDIWGVSFKTADTIAQKMGIPVNSEFRVRAGINFTMSEASNKEGHTYLTHEDLLTKSRKELGINDWNLLEKCLKHQIKEEKLIEIDQKYIFSNKTYKTELSIAENLKKLRGKVNYNIKDEDKLIDNTQKKLSIKLSKMQKEAVKLALSSKVMVLTGGPGTGKSTIINTIINILKDKRILLAAPTGRASKRMKEITGMEAKTIHRLLKYDPKINSYAYNEFNELFADLIIVDESSMIDIYLLDSLLKAIPKNCSLILVGDVDQLPSVGTGNVLNDIIESKKIKTVRLTEIFRQAKDSLIIKNAHMINRGEDPYLKGDKDSDFLFYKGNEPEDIKNGIMKLMTTIIKKRHGFDPIKDVQILTPMRKGVIGVNSLNEDLQEVLNKNRTVMTRGFNKYKIEDKVMQIKNDYEKNVFNGDVGYVKSYDSENDEISVDFDGRLVNYGLSDLDELTLAYAVSIHKSQGSEYPCVIIPIHTTHYIMLKRNLLYTGITRAKKKLIILGSTKAMDIAIKNNNIAKRNTYLKTLIELNFRI